MLRGYRGGVPTTVLPMVASIALPRGRGVARRTFLGAPNGKKNAPARGRGGPVVFLYWGRENGALSKRGLESDQSSTFLLRFREE